MIREPRKPSGRWVVITVSLLAVGLAVAGAAYALNSTSHGRPAQAAGPSASGTPDLSDNADSPLPGGEPSSAPPVPASPTPGRSHTPRPRNSTTNPAPPSPTPGQWRYAATGGGAAGTGRVYRYLVAVEASTGHDVNAFAAHVQSSLNNAQRGWIASGRWGFQRVTAAPADFTVWLATPATTDAICARYGIHTGGEVSCRGGPNVVINLTRWMQGGPAYVGHVDDYRHLVINHEVGHFLGFLHVLCPGEGQPAPVMQTQFYGMNGCLPNVWPYADDGTFVTGPPPQ